MDVQSLYNLIIWGLGVCAGGFFLLAGWIYSISRDLGTSKQILDELKQIKVGLFGDMKTLGLVAQVHHHTNTIDDIKKNCKDIQSKKQ